MPVWYHYDGRECLRCLPCYFYRVQLDRTLWGDKAARVLYNRFNDPQSVINLLPVCCAQLIALQFTLKRKSPNFLWFYKIWCYAVYRLWGYYIMGSVLLLSCHHASPLKFLENTLSDYLGVEEKHLFLDALQFYLERLCQCRKINEGKLKTEFLTWTWIIKLYKGKHSVDIMLPTSFQMFQIKLREIHKLSQGRGLFYLVAFCHNFQE